MSRDARCSRERVSLLCRDAPLKRSFQLWNSTFVKRRIEITGLCFHRTCRNVGIFTKCWDVSVHSLEFSPAPGDHLFSSIHNRLFPPLVLCPHAEMRFCISTGSIPHKSNCCGKRNFSKKKKKKNLFFFLLFISQEL